MKTLKELLGKTLFGKASSNLAFINEEMQFELSFINEKYVEFKINTFHTGANLVLVTGDQNDIFVFEYGSKYSNEKNYLHLRFLPEAIIGQTVQNGLTPGGSTFRLNYFK